MRKIEYSVNQSPSSFVSSYSINQQSPSLVDVPGTEALAISEVCFQFRNYATFLSERWYYTERNRTRTISCFIGVKMARCSVQSTTRGRCVYDCATTDCSQSQHMTTKSVLHLRLSSQNHNYRSPLTSSPRR